ncbi:MAG: hypothetical protein ABIV13_05920 [Fimbriimonadales bacterium]
MTRELQEMARRADERFPKLEGHGERTASYAVATAHRLGVSEPRLVALRIAAALHYAWAETGECPCCEPAGNTLTKWVLPEAPQSADFVRGMRADWNMAPTEASILAAACKFDLNRITMQASETTFRPGVEEALTAIAPLITPLNRSDV